MEITNKYHKSKTISHWKHYGVIYHDFDELYEIYIKTMNCTHCSKEFKNTRDRHLDHDHETGAFRKIVCNKCNTRDNYLKYPNGTPTKQQSKKNRDKKYYDKNKEKINEIRMTKYTCGCGSVLTKRHKIRHNRDSIKHSYWLMEQVD